MTRTFVQITMILTCAWTFSVPQRLQAQATRPVDVPLAGATVAVPWPELAKLLEQSRNAPAAPPVDVVFAPATYTVVPAGNAVTVTADVELTRLREGYALVPVAAGDVAVESVTVDGKPAALVLQGRTLAALVDGAGKKAMRVTLKRPLATDGGVPRFQLPLADWPITTLKLTVPGSVQVTANNAAGATIDAGADATTLTATYRGGAVADVSWRPRPAQAGAADVRLYADSETAVSVRRGLLRYRTALTVDIERGSVDSLQLAIDPAAVVLSVSGSDIARYTEEAAGDARTVTLQFSGPISGKRKIDLVYEKDVPENGGTVAVVAPRLHNTRRDSGLLAIDADRAYEVRPQTPPADPAAKAPAANANAVDAENKPAADKPAADDAAALRRISVSELPESLRGQQTTLAYRYTAPAAVSVGLTPVKPLPAKVTATTQTLVAVDRGAVRCRALINYEILHAGVDTFRVVLPKGAELTGVDGEGIRDRQVVDENGGQTLVVDLKDIARDRYTLSVGYDVPFKENARPPEGQAAGPATRPAGVAAADGKAPETKVPSPQVPNGKAPDAKSDQAAAARGAAGATIDVPLVAHPQDIAGPGYIGIETRGGFQLTSTTTAAERIDVKELPAALWSQAQSPLVQAYRYDGRAPALAVSAWRYEDLDVLVAMSDVCEATTTVAADGRSVTKLMYVVRNNLKPHMSLKLPAGAEVWSTFVDDRPVTPSRGADGTILIPLRRSEEVNVYDQDSYAARRDRRRRGEDDIKQVVRLENKEEITAVDLKPYDVEVVYVMPAVKLADRGELEMSLPQSDVPVGHLAWAVFVPKHLRVVEARGNVNQVAAFTLPFRHFADTAIASAQEQQKAQKSEQAMQQLAKDLQHAEATRVAGVLPVRVEIPIAGQITRLEKLLLVDEMPRTTLTYTRQLE